jgi:hypothetical protein
MKQILLLVLFISTISFNASATEEKPVSYAALQSFKKSFVTAKEVSWNSTAEFLKVSFQYSSQYITAYYEHNGTLIATTKNILSNQLPLMLETNLKEHYSGYWISSVVEYSTENEITYYAVIENAEQKITLKAFQNSWYTEKKYNK